MTSAGNFLYQIKNVFFSYTLDSFQFEALKDVSLNVTPFSFVTLSGPSGSGKSTLLNLLGLIEPLQSGQIFFQDKKISSMSPTQLNAIRKFKIGFIFQQFHLIPVFTAEENVAYFLGRQGLNSDQIKRGTRDSLEAVGLWSHRSKKPSELSGGQRQRVAIARALAKSPEVLIGDEPTASLDQTTGKEIVSIFHELVVHKKTTVILATHDPMVQAYAHENFCIQDGALVK